MLRGFSPCWRCWSPIGIFIIISAAAHRPGFRPDAALQSPAEYVDPEYRDPQCCLLSCSCGSGERRQRNLPWQPRSMLRSPSRSAIACPARPVTPPRPITYGANCFDTLNIIQADSSGAGCVASTDNGTSALPVAANRHRQHRTRARRCTWYRRLGTAQANAIALGGTNGSPTFHSGDELLLD